LRGLRAAGDALEVRILVKVEPDIRVAGFAGIASNDTASNWRLAPRQGRGQQQQQYTHTVGLATRGIFHNDIRISAQVESIAWRIYMALEVLIVGGGMIVHDQILPSLYQLQRQGRVGEIAVCASRHETVRALAEADGLLRAFPGQRFRMYPESASAGRQPELFREAMG